MDDKEANVAGVTDVTGVTDGAPDRRSNDRTKNETSRRNFLRIIGIAAAASILAVEGVKNLSGAREEASGPPYGSVEDVFMATVAEVMEHRGLDGKGNIRKIAPKLKDLLDAMVKNAEKPNVSWPGYVSLVISAVDYPRPGDDIFTSAYLNEANNPNLQLEATQWKGGRLEERNNLSGVKTFLNRMPSGAGFELRMGMPPVEADGGSIEALVVLANNDRSLGVSRLKGFGQEDAVRLGVLYAMKSADAHIEVSCVIDPMEDLLTYTYYIWRSESLPMLIRKQYHRNSGEPLSSPNNSPAGEELEPNIDPKGEFEKLQRLYLRTREPDLQWA